MTDSAPASPGQAAAPSAPAAPPAGTPPPAAPSAPAPGAAPAGSQPTPPPADGSVSLQPDFVEWGKSKGYTETDLQNPIIYKMAQSYRETEKMLGSFQSGDKLPLPKDLTKMEELMPIFDRLGRPKTADDYKMEIPQGGDNAFALEAGKWFHKYGVTQMQAEGISKEWNAHVTRLTTESTTESETRARSEEAQLTSDWGSEYDANRELAERAWNRIAGKLGMDGVTIEQMEASPLGVKNTLKMMHLFGEMSKVSGDKFFGSETGSRQQATVLTKADAMKERDRLTNDPAFAAKLRSKDAESVKRWNQINYDAAYGN